MQSMKSATFSLKKAEKERVGHLPSMEERREEDERALWILIGLLASFAVVTTSALAMIGGQEEIGIAAPKASYTVKAAMRVMSEGYAPMSSWLASIRWSASRSVERRLLSIRQVFDKRWLGLVQHPSALASSPNDLNDFPQANGNPILASSNIKRTIHPLRTSGRTRSHSQASLRTRM